VLAINRHILREIFQIRRMGVGKFQSQCSQTSMRNFRLVLTGARVTGSGRMLGEC
jgi:hypothetical protein